MAQPTLSTRLTPVLLFGAVMVLGLVLQRGWMLVELGGAAPHPVTAGPDAAGGEGAREAAGASAGAVPAGLAGPAFTDISAAAGLGSLVHDRGARGQWWIPELLGAGAAFLDADGDGDLDLYWVPGGPLDPGDPAATPQRARLLTNDGRGHFTDVSAGSGADLEGHAFGAAAADYDGDGDTDLYVTRLGADVLLANDGAGHFTDVTAAAGLGRDGWTSSAAWFDADGDGDLDLYVAAYVEWSPALERPCYGVSGVRDYCNPLTYPPLADALYENRGDGSFADVSASSGIGAVARDGLAVLCTDVDADGDVDVYVANDQMAAFLWRNVTGEDDAAGDPGDPGARGDRGATAAGAAPIRFREEAMLSGAAFNRYGMAIAGMGLAAEDLDDDGDLDLLVTNIVTQSHLGLRNDGGWFEDASGPWGLDRWSVPSTGWGLALFDQDLDGQLDLFVANGHVNLVTGDGSAADPFAQANQFARRDDKGRFVPVDPADEPALTATGTSRAVLTGDIDNDGDLDLLVTNNGGAPQLLRNEADGAYLQLDLRERDGTTPLNARVTVTAGGRSWHRELRPHSGYLGTNDPRVQLGLAGATAVERVVITWPDGARDELTDLPAPARLRVTRGVVGAAPTVEVLP